MSSVEDIEKAVERLSVELARLRAWFAEYDAARFDEQIVADVKGGRLDRLAAEALVEHRRCGSYQI